MSALYSVSVLKNHTPTSVDLNIQVVHPDSMYVSATPGFALMLLQESANEGDPISKEIDFDSASDPTWLKKYAMGFVTEVIELSSENVPPDAAHSDSSHAYWTSDNWLSAVIRITVSHQDWIAHLSEGQNWDSASYEPNNAYDACDVIVPTTDDGDAPELAANDRAGFLPIPSFFFMDMYGHLPSPVWVPKYGPSAYVSDEMFEEEAVTDAVIASMLGKPVLFKSWGDQDVGIVTSNDLVSTLSTGSWGQTGISAGSGQIGIARFNTKKKRLSAPITYQFMTQHVDPLIEAVTVNGDRATLTILSVDPERDLQIQHSADALALLIQMEYESFDGFENSTSPLGQFLHRKMTEDDMNFESEAFSKFAGGLIKSFSMSKTSAGKTVDFDALDNDALLAELTSDPWTTFTATVEVTDPAWIEHLASAAPFSYGFHWVQDPKPWNDGPLMSTDVES